MRITILNFGEGEDLTASSGGPGGCGWEIDKLAAHVRRAKKRGDFVVVVAHAGLEYIPFPPPYIVAAYRALSAAGPIASSAITPTSPRAGAPEGPAHRL